MGRGFPLTRLAQDSRNGVRRRVTSDLGVVTTGASAPTQNKNLIPHTRNHRQTSKSFLRDFVTLGVIMRQLVYAYKPLRRCQATIRPTVICALQTARLSKYTRISNDSASV